MNFNTPSDLRYSKSHEWVRVDGNEVVIGISDYAQDALGDVVYIELPQVGANYLPGGTFGVVESVKASSDLYAPVGGTVVAVNTDLEGNQEPINKDPYGSGWLLRLAPSGEEGELMDATAYAAYVEEIAH
jgi:glycine cleavage system H protein